MINIIFYYNKTMIKPKEKVIKFYFSSSKRNVEKKRLSRIVFLMK